MELNEQTKNRIALKVLAAMENEKLLNKELAGIFDTSPVYMSYLKHYAEKREKPGFISVAVWNMLRAWYYSEKPLKYYKAELLPEAPVREYINQPDLAALKRESRLATNQLKKEFTSELDEMVSETMNIGKKEEQAASIRYEYEKSNGVSIDELNKKTGTHIRLDIYGGNFSEIEIRLK